MREDLVDPEFITTRPHHPALQRRDNSFKNWDTPKGANKCYRVTMTARDGSLLSAFFKDEITRRSVEAIS